MLKSIHKFKKDGYNIVVDICSGGVHIVDGTIYEMLDFLELPLPLLCPESLFEAFPDTTREVINECYEQIHDLHQQGMLFSADDYINYTSYSGDVPLKALCLHVAHDCNLRCAYCFASTGDFGAERLLMTPQTGKKAIDFLINNSNERKYLEVDFFGGEPLMAWDTVKATVDYARSIEALYNKVFRFTLTTNGVLLDDEKIEYINSEMTNVVLSLDGRREINDLMRPAINGSGSYDIILPKFKKLVSVRKKAGRTDYFIRGTFTKNNLDFTNDVLCIAENGFKNISVEPVTANADLPYAFSASDIPKIQNEYDRLYDIIKERSDLNFFHFNLDLEQGPCAIKRLRGCGAGGEYAAITPEGDIYPCHQFVGIEKWRMGNIKTKSTDKSDMLDPDIKKYFIGTHVYSKQDCKDCWARFYCSGGCNAANYLYEGDVRVPHKISCELMKKRIECAIALKVQEHKPI